MYLQFSHHDLFLIITILLHGCRKVILAKYEDITDSNIVTSPLKINQVATSVTIVNKVIKNKGETSYTL